MSSTASFTFSCLFQCTDIYPHYSASRPFLTIIIFLHLTLLLFRVLWFAVAFYSSPLRSHFIGPFFSTTYSVCLLLRSSSPSLLFFCLLLHLPFSTFSCSFFPPPHLVSSYPTVYTAQLSPPVWTKSSHLRNMNLGAWTRVLTCEHVW